MISLDWSIIPAIIIFVLTIIIVNTLLFRPVLKVQAERESRTTGLMSRTRRDLDHHMRLFDEYQVTIRNARIEGYRLVEKSRARALQYRAGVLENSRDSAEQLIREGRELIRDQIVDAKVRLERDALEIARQIASAILQRPA